jgi:hypothetical protein
MGGCEEEVAMRGSRRSMQQTLCPSSGRRGTSSTFHDAHAGESFATIHNLAELHNPRTKTQRLATCQAQPLVLASVSCVNHKLCELLRCNAEVLQSAATDNANAASHRNAE